MLERENAVGLVFHEDIYALLANRLQAGIHGAQSGLGSPAGKDRVKLVVAAGDQNFHLAYIGAVLENLKELVANVACLVVVVNRGQVAFKSRAVA